MQLSFEKDADGHISVKFKQGDTYEEFLYPEMIKKMYNEKTVDDSEMLGDFTQIEIKSINDLTKELQGIILESASVENEKKEEVFNS